jgi:alpha-mannosidase
MLKHLPLTTERVKQFTAAFLPRIYPEERPLAFEVFSAPGRIPFAEAAKGAYRTAREGERFGPRWSTHWLRVESVIPPEWRGQEVHLRVQSRSEMLVWDSSGHPLQGLVTFKWNGLSDVRSHYPLTRKARGDEKHTHYIEAAITGLMGFWGELPDTDAPDLGEVRTCRLARFDRLAWDVYHDLLALDLLARTLPEKHHLRLRATTAANTFVNLLIPDDRATWPAARRVAAAFFADNAGSRRFRVSAMGHAHIDTAWLWPIGEAVRKCARSFASQIHLFKSYPEHKFVCSQAQQLAWMRDRYPSLYADIKKHARAGRFIPCGGAWVEPDCNLPSGESLVRQFLLGQRFYEREFGRRHREFWNPDVFGYSAAMPQILKGVGIDFFLTQKLSWNQFNKPVASTFLWEGIDGTRVLTHFPPADTYNGNCEPNQLFDSMENHRDLERSTEACYLFGHGDGGGGATEGHLELLRRYRDLDGLPSVEIRGPEEFFERLARDTTDPLVWSGELYFELHRGTYTTQAANKRDNRRSEELLHDAEFLSALAHATGAAPYPQAELTRLWELTCLNQFHDIIPGSSIREVYEDSARDYADILGSAATLREQAASALWPAAAKAPRLLPLNTLSFARREVVVTPAGPRLLSAPSLGYTVTEANADDATALPSDIAPVTLTRRGGRVTLANGLVRAVFDASGLLVSFVDLRAERECIADDETGNRFVLFDDTPANWDAWDVDAFHLEKRREVGAATRIEILTTHALLAEIALERPLTAKSHLRQTIRLRAGSSVLEFANTCDWQEDHQFLKVEFPLALRSDHATYEIQFGHVRRPTHFNTSWDMARFEVCAHRWADLSEPDFGVALLNDCKYGHACHGHILRLSLLRAPTFPDPLADRGTHSFRYGLYPHVGGPQAGGVVAVAAAFNQPLQLRPTALPAGDSRSFFSVDHPGVVIDTVKKAEDSTALIVRLYESHGTRARVRLTTTVPFKSVTRVNLLEDPLPATAASPSPTLRDAEVTFAIKPFEIITLRLA